ncbi:hypothetical protein BS78_K319100 [Paspalum vaginatum]|uniref:Uncharacterized protein n=1 Tax=Paspalum vaginatum TaxID=158149 RepID=A0A9W7XB34_9POAL|nr:hypothetical protein BS78_K319100 [Paspalum vaginatum]
MKSHGIHKRTSHRKQADPAGDVLEQPAKRPRFKKAGCKPPKIPEANQALVEQQKARLCIRCNPQQVLEAIEILNGPQNERICSFGWGRFLDMKINAVESRELFLWLLERIDVDALVLIVNPNTILPLTKSAVETVLGIPSGTRSPPSKPPKDVSNDKKKFADALQCGASKITI